MYQEGFAHHNAAVQTIAAQAQAREQSESQALSALNLFMFEHIRDMLTLGSSDGRSDTRTEVCYSYRVVWLILSFCEVIWMQPF